MHVGLGLAFLAAVSVSACSSATDGSVPSTTLAAEQVSGDCHPSYAGKCVPHASDVDCAGGSGNGPSYVEGPVQVIGPDVYELDRDGDGAACEPFKR